MATEERVHPCFYHQCLASLKKTSLSLVCFSPHTLFSPHSWLLCLVSRFLRQPLINPPPLFILLACGVATGCGQIDWSPTAVKLPLCKNIAANPFVPHVFLQHPCSSRSGFANLNKQSLEKKHPLPSARITFLPLIKILLSLGSFFWPMKPHKPTHTQSFITLKNVLKGIVKNLQENKNFCESF